MSFYQSPSCCGMREWSGLLSTPNGTLKEMYKLLFGNTSAHNLFVKHIRACGGNATTEKEVMYDYMPYGIIVFSDKVISRGYDDFEDRDYEDEYYESRGVALADFIANNKLGEVVVSKQTYNPNSHNDIAAWFWSVDHLALLKWWKSNIDELKDGQDNKDLTSG